MQMCKIHTGFCFTCSDLGGEKNPDPIKPVGFKGKEIDFWTKTL